MQPWAEAPPPAADAPTATHPTNWPVHPAYAPTATVYAAVPVDVSSPSLPNAASLPRCTDVCTDVGVHVPAGLNGAPAAGTHVR